MANSVKKEILSAVASYFGLDQDLARLTPNTSLERLLTFEPQASITGLVSELENRLGINLQGMRIDRESDLADIINFVLARTAKQ